MKRSSVLPSVCPSIDIAARRTAGLLLSVPLAGDIDRLPGAQQQRRRSTALSSECGQCHADS